MSEERMKLISSGTEEPMSLKLSFKIKSLATAECIHKTPTLHIYDIARIQLFLKQSSGDENSYAFRVKKATLAKELGIQLHVVCEKPAHESKILCTERWSRLQRMGNSNDTLFSIQINVVMTKADLMVLKLYNDETFTDFHLSTAEGSVAVHRAQMAVNSEVFKIMLSGTWKETTEGRIEMDGVTLQTLQDLKVYMYLGALPLPQDRLCPLLFIARCYLMNTLKDECITELVFNQGSETG